MSKEHVAWIADDGELTESKALMENWKRFGHDFIGLNQDQFDAVNKLHAQVAERLTNKTGYDFSDLRLEG